MKLQGSILVDGEASILCNKLTEICCNLGSELKQQGGCLGYLEYMWENVQNLVDVQNAK